MIFRMKIFEFHHLYIGLVLMGIAYWLSPHTTWSIYLYAVGAVITFDDLYQHRRQVKDENYHSPLHNLYGKYLYPIPFIQKLNKWADSVLRKAAPWKS